MARKKSRKKKKSGIEWLSFVLILAIAVLAAALFIRSEKGKEAVDDIKNSELVQNIVNHDSKNQEQSKAPDVPEGTTDIRVDFIDVGQGDSELITTSSGRYILVDAGPSGSKNALVQYLENAGVSEIEYFILSHPHADHIGGAEKVLSEFKVNNIIMPSVATTSATFTKLLEAIASEKESGCKVYSAIPGDKYSVDGCTVTVLAPHEPDEDDLNNSSAVVKFVYKDFSVLFTGDAEKESEKLMLNSGASLDCDILKVGHHGSSTSTSSAFLDAVSPELAVISCKKDNEYGHPHAETIAALKKRNIPYCVTSEKGTVTVISDGEEYKIFNEKE